jgi:hypothetical protein
MRFSTLAAARRTAFFFASVVSFRASSALAQEPPPAPAPDAGIIPSQIVDRRPPPPIGYRIVYFESTARPAALQVDWWGSGDKKSWVTVCQAPCRAAITPNATLRVGGPGVHASQPFVVPPGMNRITADAGSRSGWVTGIALLAVGASVGGLGLTVVALDYSSNRTINGEGATIVLSVSGLAMAAVGLGLMLSNPTDVIVTSSSSVSSAPRMTPQGFVF